LRDGGDEQMAAGVVGEHVHGGAGAGARGGVGGHGEGVVGGHRHTGGHHGHGHVGGGGAGGGGPGGVAELGGAAGTLGGTIGEAPSEDRIDDDRAVGGRRGGDDPQVIAGVVGEHVDGRLAAAADAGVEHGRGVVPGVRRVVRARDVGEDG